MGDKGPPCLNPGGRFGFVNIWCADGPLAEYVIPLTFLYLLTYTGFSCRQANSTVANCLDNSTASIDAPCICSVRYDMDINPCKYV